MAVNRYDTPAQIDVSWQPYELPWDLIAAKLSESQQQKDLFDNLSAKLPEYLDNQYISDEPFFRQYAQFQQGIADSIQSEFQKGNYQSAMSKLNEGVRQIARQWQPGGAADTFQQRKKLWNERFDEYRKNRLKEGATPEMLFHDIQSLRQSTEDYFSSQGLNFGSNNSYGQIGQSQVAAYFDIAKDLNTTFKSFKDEGDTSISQNGAYITTTGYKGVPASRVYSAGENYFNNTKASTQLDYEAKYNLHYLNQLSPREKQEDLNQMALIATEKKLEMQLDNSNLGSTASFLRQLSTTNDSNGNPYLSNPKTASQSEIQDAKNRFIEDSAKELANSGDLNVIKEYKKINYIAPIVERESGLVIDKDLKNDNWWIAQWKRKKELEDRASIELPTSVGTQTKQGKDLKKTFESNKDNLSILRDQYTTSTDPKEKAYIENRMADLEAANKRIKAFALSNISQEDLAKSLKEGVFSNGLLTPQKFENFESVYGNIRGTDAIAKLEDKVINHISTKLKEDPNYDVAVDNEVKDIWKRELMNAGNSSAEADKITQNVFNNKRGALNITYFKEALHGLPIPYVTSDDSKGLSLRKGITLGESLDNFILGNTEDKELLLVNTTINAIDDSAYDAKLEKLIQDQLQNGFVTGVTLEGSDVSADVLADILSNSKELKPRVKMLGTPIDGQDYLQMSYEDADKTSHHIAFKIDSADPDKLHSLHRAFDRGDIDRYNNAADRQVKANAAFRFGSRIAVYGENINGDPIIIGKTLGQEFEQVVDMMRNTGDTHTMNLGVYGKLVVEKLDNGFTGRIVGKTGVYELPKFNRKDDMVALLGETFIQN